MTTVKNKNSRVLNTLIKVKGFESNATKIGIQSRVESSLFTSVVVYVSHCMSLDGLWVYRLSMKGYKVDKIGMKAGIKIKSFKFDGG